MVLLNIVAKLIRSTFVISKVFLISRETEEQFVTIQAYDDLKSDLLDLIIQRSF